VTICSESGVAPPCRLGAALRARASAPLRAQISQFGVDVIRGVGFVVRLDERTPRESLWLVTGRPAAARAEDLDTFFASPLKGALGLADAVLVRPDWSILVDGSAQQAQSKSARARRAGSLWSALVVNHDWAALAQWRAAIWSLVLLAVHAPSWQVSQAGSMNELSSRHFRNWLVALWMVRLPHVIENSRTSSVARSPCARTMCSS
jgi:hypothetical protein